MNAVVSSVFHVIFFPHEGKIVMIDLLDYCVPSTHLITTTNFVPLVRDNPGFMRALVQVYSKYHPLFEFFLYPRPTFLIFSTIASMHMVSYVTYGPHSSPDPWVVSSSIDVDRHGEHTPPPLVDYISYLTVMSVPPKTSEKFHPNMDYW